MAEQSNKNSTAIPDIDVTLPGTAASPQAFDPNTTAVFQSKMKHAPEWFCSMMASNGREKRRMADELSAMKGALPLLMKQRNGGKWSPEEKAQLGQMVRTASSVSPYVFIWVLPGSLLLLPFLAWYMDKRRKKRSA